MIQSGIFERYIAPAIAAVLTNIMMCSPLPAVLEVRKRQKLGELNPLPYPVIVANCVSWSMYAVVTKDFFLILANIPAIIIGIFLTQTCVVYASQNVRDIMMGTLVFFPTIYILYIFVLTACNASIQTVRFAIGLCDNIALIIYFAAPLSTFFYVIKRRDSSSLHLPQIFMNFTNSCLWFIYGFFGLNDPLIWIVNVVGVVLSVIALFLRIIFPRKAAKNLDLEFENQLQDDQSEKLLQ
eukprot:TRINITY_DN12360_c0_g6_i1.p1 TRINITY_DN12360_c0_g6~~TRINITY_DN12360_c0_g6_i1.p1  ORF type:complete len:239 (-),score=21.29 TRINITY_DN12360_c0_g6_i1:83-799(-)